MACAEGPGYEHKLALSPSDYPTDIAGRHAEAELDGAPQAVEQKLAMRHNLVGSLIAGPFLLWGVLVSWQ